MNQIDIDILKTRDVHNIKYSPQYGKVYFKTNEFLEDLFKNVDLNGKDVLTVLGSGDQAFLCYEKGAKSVDVFDINKLAIYYFYLRIWVIEYYDKFYPQLDFNNNYIFELLKLVSPKTEEERAAYEYWENYIKNYFPKSNGLFYEQNGVFQLSISDLSNIKKRISSREFNTYNIDISSEIDIDKKYDVIITSNISDYIPKNDSNFNNYMNNLMSCLRDDGVIVCSKFSNHKISSCERNAFKESFKRKSFPKVWIYGELESPGYSYQKRKV